MHGHNGEQLLAQYQTSGCSTLNGAFFVYGQSRRLYSSLGQQMQHFLTATVAQNPVIDGL